MNRAERRQIERELKRLVRRNERRQNVAIADDEKWEVEVPGESGNHFTFRRLAGPEWDEADAQGSLSGAEAIKRLPERVVSEQLAEERERERAAMERGEPEEKKSLERQFIGFDQTVLVKYGLIGWRGPKYDGRPCDPETKLRLDPKTRRFAAWELFVKEAETEGEAEGSDKSSSTESTSPADSSEPIASILQE